MTSRIVMGGILAVAGLLAQPAGGPRGRFGPGFGPGGMGGRGPVVTGAPYSGVEVRSEQQLLANGNLIQRQEQRNISRDNQGRTRVETTRAGANGQTETWVTISDPVAGMIHELDVANKVSYDRPARFPNQAGGANPGGRIRNSPNRAELDTNVRRETLAAQSMNGVIATGARVTRTIPAGRIGNSLAIDIVQETWTSEDLKIPVMTKTSDPRSGTTVTQLTNINRSEPDAALFQVPSGYTSRSMPGGPMGPPRGRGNGRANAQ